MRMHSCACTCTLARAHDARPAGESFKQRESFKHPPTHTYIHTYIHTYTGESFKQRESFKHPPTHTYIHTYIHTYTGESFKQRESFKHRARDEGGSFSAMSDETTLDLSSQHLSFISAIVIAPLVRDNTVLTDLNIAGNDLAPEGMTILAESLRVESLLALDLSHNVVPMMSGTKKAEVHTRMHACIRARAPMRMHPCTHAPMRPCAHAPMHMHPWPHVRRSSRSS